MFLWVMTRLKKSENDLNLYLFEVGLSETNWYDCGADVENITHFLKWRVLLKSQTFEGSAIEVFPESQNCFVFT